MHPGTAAPGIARICALALGLDELLDQACREILSVCGGDACCVASWGGPPGGTDVWRHRASADGPDPADAYRQASLWEEPRRLLETEGIRPIDDTASLSPDDPLRALFDFDALKSLLLVPLKFGSRQLGVLALHSFGIPRRWDPEAIRAAAGIAPILSAALERRRMEQRLRASEARYRFLAENALDFISLHDRFGKYLYASPASRGMLDYRPEEMAGCPAVSFLHPEDHEKIAEGNRRLVSGEAQAVTIQHRLRRRDGSFAEVETVSTAVPDDRGEVRQVLRITRDIGERKRIESRLFESQKSETIGLLAGGIAHEFNNLLAGINGAVEMLALLLAGNAEVERYLSMIDRLGNRAAVLTRQLLAYARQGNYSPGIIGLNRAVLEDLPVLKSALGASVELSLDLAEDVPPVHADITQIKQVVTSLCINAGEAMPEGGTLTIRTRKAEGPAPSGARAVLEVEDTGCGMDGATLDRIFDPFFSTKFIGRGMGLAAVRGIVENHDGEILVASRVGKGTTFTVAFPASAGTADEAESREALPVCGTARILVADDEDDVRAVVRAMLESFGYRVIEARDGREAVDLFRERHGEIDLVLLDLMMPRMTGEEALAEMRKTNPGVRAILASGYDESGRLREILAAGFDTFLQKPFRRRELGQKVGDAIRPLPRIDAPGEN